MNLRSFAHKGLQKLYVDDSPSGRQPQWTTAPVDDSPKGVPPDAADKLRKMLAFLEAMEDAEELRSLPLWRAHILTGDRRRTWSLSVTSNRRLTFLLDAAKREIHNINLEDYH